MEYKVRIVYDGKLIEPPDYPKIVISNKTIDRIVNDIYERETGAVNQNGMSVDEDSFEMTMCM